MTTPNKNISEEYLRNHPLSTAEEFRHDTDLNNNYYYRAKKKLGLTIPRPVTKTELICAYIKEHGYHSIAVLQKLFDCSRATVVDARGMAGVSERESSPEEREIDARMIEGRKAGKSYATLSEEFDIPRVTIRSRVIKQFHENLTIKKPRGKNKPKQERMEIDPSNYNKWLMMKWA